MQNKNTRIVSKTNTNRFQSKATDRNLEAGKKKADGDNGKTAKPNSSIKPDRIK